MVTIFLKPAPRFEYGEAVIANCGYFEGRIGLVSNIKRRFPFSYEYIVNFQITLTDEVISATDNFTKDEIEKYVQENQLVRPLRVGDYIYIADDFVAFYNTTSLKYRGKKLRITEINDSPFLPYFPFYHTGTGGRWLDINLDIPRTNRLLMKDYQPKVNAHLPDI